MRPQPAVRLAALTLAMASASAFASASVSLMASGEGTQLEAVAAPPEVSAEEAAPAVALPEDWNLLHGIGRHCRQAFAGRVVVNEADDGPDPVWEKGPVVLDVRDCPPGGIILALAVGDDRSRTMVLRRQSADQLSLRQLRHNDEGQPLPVTDFGGFSSEESSARTAIFQANDISRELFSRHDQSARSNSVWTLAMPDASTLVYEETSDAGRLKLEFDLGEPVEQRPLPWVEAAVR
ncbi:MAG: hypothetical protein M0Q42_00755 [Xanthomonadales bacterium]|nr:hypothetical protein [Xanthomonadales bacterium]